MRKEIEHFYICNSARFSFEYQFITITNSKLDNFYIDFMYAHPYDSYKHLPPLNLPHSINYQPNTFSLPMLSLYKNPRNLNDQVSKQYQNENIDDRFQKQQQQQTPRYNPTDQIEGKSFIDTFDNNTSGLLNQNKSFARNIQGRLLNNTLDHDAERAKQEKLSDYRMSLKKQMEEVRERKKA